MQKAKSSSSSWWTSVKSTYYNVTYTAKSNSSDELSKLLTNDKKGNTVMNLQIKILDQQYPVKANNTKELVTEV